MNSAFHVWLSSYNPKCNLLATTPDLASSKCWGGICPPKRQGIERLCLRPFWRNLVVCRSTKGNLDGGFVLFFFLNVRGPTRMLGLRDGWQQFNQTGSINNYKLHSNLDSKAMAFAQDGSIYHGCVHEPNMLTSFMLPVATGCRRSSYHDTKNNHEIHGTLNPNPYELQTLNSRPL